MQVPIVNSKARSLRAAFMYFFACMGMSAMAHYIGTEGGLFELNLWPMYLGMVGFWLIFYMLFFKIETKRQWRIFIAFGLSGFLCLALLHSFWWSGLVMLAVMMAVLLIGQLYFERNADREKPPAPSSAS